jgi:hypothetical protein
VSEGDQQCEEGSCKALGAYQGFTDAGPHFHHLTEDVGLNQISCSYENDDNNWWVSFVDICAATCQVFTVSDRRN